MKKSILILNGPNLNRLGKRQPEIYGATTLAEVEIMCCDIAKDAGYSATCLQSNHEGEIIEAIHGACDDAEIQAIVINPGAFTHTSIAILDALNGFDGPVIEIHISNIHKREPFRHHSYISGRADAVIAGCGVQGYRYAVEQATSLLD